MNIAVVGAGIFGVTIALRLDKIHNVTLYESANDILTAASRINQLRLHRGYHYPRSPDTVKILLESVGFFVDEYNESVIDSYDHYYCIARNESKVTPAQYIKFCDLYGLEYDIIDNFPYINNDKIALTIKVRESLLDYQSVYSTCRHRLLKSSVKRRFNTKFMKHNIQEFDVVINCTYANINDILDEEDKRKYQFEVCEKIAVIMPSPLVKKSIVVMDGPFMCVDPYGNTGMSLLGNVVHAIHHTNTGLKAKVPPSIAEDLNKGIRRNPTNSNWQQFIKTGKEYVPPLALAKYVGSMFTVRTVLPNMDDTDGRPTVVSSSGPKIINVFSGKIDTCVTAAKKIIDQLTEEER